MMRKAFATITILLLSSFLLFAETAMAGKNDRNPDAIGQTVYGYVDDVFSIEISAPIYSGNGFNLNFSDTSNPYRFELAPTQTALESPGLKIGYFSVVTSKTDIVLRITHTPLILHYEDNGSSATEWVDWELGVTWETDGETQVGMCLSSNWDSESAVPENLRVIEIPMNEGSVRIQNSGLFFRMTSSSPITREGKYISSIIFEVEDL